MSGDDGRIPVTMYVEPPDDDGDFHVYADADGKIDVGWVFGRDRAKTGIPVPPPPPVKVTLSIELDEADVRGFADGSGGSVTSEVVWGVTRLACCAWVAANPEGEKP